MLAPPPLKLLGGPGPPPGPPLPTPMFNTCKVNHGLTVGHLTRALLSVGLCHALVVSLCQLYTIRCWLVGYFRFNGPLRQYFSLYRAVSQRQGIRGERRYMRVKNVQTIPTRTYCKGNRPLPYCNPNCRTSRHWKFTQHHRTTRPPQLSGDF